MFSKTNFRPYLQPFLHCCYKEYRPQEELKNTIPNVFYYPRKNKVNSLKLGSPFIVESRRNLDLLEKLNQDNAPIIFEGLHTTAFLNHTSLKHRYKIVRTHNVEWEYYQHLALASKDLFNKTYFKRESRLLKNHEQVLSHAQEIWSISPADTNYYQNLFPDRKEVIKYLPAFHLNNSVSSLEGKGTYALYHGNLSVAENLRAVEMLLNEVIPYTDIKWIIAGRNPGNDLKNHCSRINDSTNTPNKVELIANPENDLLENLLSNAHLNVLPTFQATGIKLKLLNALHKGRFCVVNPPMVEQTGLESICEIVLNPTDFIKKITTLQQISFSAEMMEKRKELLGQHFNNQKNAAQIVDWLDKAGCLKTSYETWLLD